MKIAPAQRLACKPDEQAAAAAADKCAQNASETIERALCACAVTQYQSSTAGAILASRLPELQRPLSATILPPLWLCTLPLLLPLALLLLLLERATRVPKWRIRRPRGVADKTFRIRVAPDERLEVAEGDKWRPCASAPNDFMMAPGACLLFGRDFWRKTSRTMAPAADQAVAPSFWGGEKLARPIGARVGRWAARGASPGSRGELLRSGGGGGGMQSSARMISWWIDDFSKKKERGENLRINLPLPRGAIEERLMMGARARAFTLPSAQEELNERPQGARVATKWYKFDSI